jgi:SAM-dependent methyltransferase
VTFRDHFSAGAAEYAAFRPHYPGALFDFLAESAPARNDAWDAGTGSGQAAVDLARLFANVIATDPSARQIERATPHPRVTYRVEPAERSSLEPSSMDLVTAAQAVHWFDRTRFWGEVRRVLRPRGVIAVWTYLLFEIAPPIDEIVRQFYGGIVGPYWPPERRLTEQRYQTIEFPFAEFDAPDFVIEQFMTLDDVAGYIRTWSATRSFMKHHQVDPVDDLVKELTRAWQSHQPRLARWPIAMRVGRVA